MADEVEKAWNFAFTKYNACGYTSSASAGSAPVSLWLGHATALTVHWPVIHYRSAASLPQGEGYEVRCEHCWLDRRAQDVI